MLRALLGHGCLVSGIAEDEEDGRPMLRVYVGARYERLYVLVDDPDEAEKFRRAWHSSKHLWLDDRPPPSAIWSEDERP